jgi:hypothetical protein
MTAWRVTYLPESTAGRRRPVTVTVDDPASVTLDSFVVRLSGGALGAEWTRGRVIQSIEAPEHSKRRQRTAGLTALAAVIVVSGVVLVGFYVPIPHSWSFTIYASGSCPNGCGDQTIYQSYPNGSQVSGSWSAPYPLSLIISTANGIVCPAGGIQSGPTSCSQTNAASGSFEFTSMGGTVSFVALSQNPENVSVSGSWSAVAW